MNNSLENQNPKDVQFGEQEMQQMEMLLMENISFIHLIAKQGFDVEVQNHHIILIMLPPPPPTPPQTISVMFLHYNYSF